MRMTKHVLPGLLAGLLLAACSSSPEPGPDPSTTATATVVDEVAASVDDRTLTVGDVVSGRVAFFADYPSSRGSAEPDRVEQLLIQNWVRNQVVDQIGEAYDLEPTPEQLDQLATERFGSRTGFAQAAANQAIGSSQKQLLDAELRSIWIQNAVREQLREEMGLPEGPSDELDIATQDVNEQFAADADITIDPRFGTWDAARGIILAPGASATPE